VDFKTKRTKEEKNIKRGQMKKEGTHIPLNFMWPKGYKGKGKFKKVENAKPRRCVIQGAK